MGRCSGMPVGFGENLQPNLDKYQGDIFPK